MTLDPKLISLSKTTRPEILKLARRQKLVDECFKAFQRQVYPGAPPAMVAEMRTVFFAGVAEMNALLIYGSDTATVEPTDEDLQFLSNINAEVERYYRRVIKVANVDRSEPQ